MNDSRPIPTLSEIPGFASLTPDQQAQLQAMADNMQERGLPPELIASGLRSTAQLLLDQQREATPRIQTAPVRQFLNENSGTPISHRSRAVPRKETKARTRERLHEQLSHMLATARTANRRHEMLKIRREMLALDQGYIRRTLGQEGDTLCGEISAWLIEAATRLNQGR